MAEVVEYRIEKTAEELKLLVDFGLLTHEQVKEVLAKRENFEYKLRKRNKSKLDYLKYIRFEVNLLESIDNYRKTVIKDFYKSTKNQKTEDLDRKILLLQAKKLNDVIRSRSAHISSLYRKLTISFQFDKALWLSYIEFAKSRKWNTRASALYWRMLRVLSHDCDLWLKAADHEVNDNRAFDTARYLYLRAVRHHPESAKVWAGYFKMELDFMDVVDQRARIIFKLSKKEVDSDKEEKDEDIWVDKDNPDDDSDESINVDVEPELAITKTDPIRKVEAVEKDDKILTGHLPKVIYDNAIKTLDNPIEFIHLILRHLIPQAGNPEGLANVLEYICQDIKRRITEGDTRFPEELAEQCEDGNKLNNYLSHLDENFAADKNIKKPIKRTPSMLDTIYECYETKGLEKTRELYNLLERSVKNRTLSLYVAMIQVEYWQLPNDKSVDQLNRVRSVYDKALTIFGRTKPKLWYEYIQFEQDHAKSLEDFNRINLIYCRAQSTLDKSKVDRVVEKYTLLQARSSRMDLEYSDYSDLDE